MTVEDKPECIEVNGIKVAVGNLVADGDDGAKIGAPTDKGLFFQFGSLVSEAIFWEEWGGKESDTGVNEEAPDPTEASDPHL